MVRLGRREVNRSHSPTVTDDDDMRPETPPLPQIHMQVRKQSPTLYSDHLQMESNVKKVLVLLVIVLFALDKDNVPIK